MIGFAAFLKSILPYLPGVGGAAVSMAFGEGLTVRGKALSVICGLVSALWIAPGLAVVLSLWWPGNVVPGEMLAFVGFVCGLFGMTAFAGLMKFVARWAQNPFGMVKLKIGPLDIDGGRG